MNHKKLLLTLTLCLCALLCMAVTASASEVQNTGSHSHELCKKTVCTNPEHIKSGTHGSVTFEKALTMNDDGVLYIGGGEAGKYTGQNYDYILPEGTYYLDDNLTLNKGIQVQGNVTLCLNGHKITCDKLYVIQMLANSRVTFTLCDCIGTGVITHTANSTSNAGGVILGDSNNDTDHSFIMYNGCITPNKGSGVYLQSKASFTMYGGSITGNTLTDAPTFGGGVYVHSGASFTMYGGEITKNQADYGGGVSTSGNTANFTMHGGSITGNHANKSGGGIYSTSNNISIYGGGVTNNSVTKNGKAGGIYVSDPGTLTVGGNVNISGNWKGDSKESGSKNNVYLDYYNGAFASIVIKEALTGAPIGITTANAPTAGNPVTIVTGNSIEEAYKDSFQADNAAYGVSYNSTDKVLQLHKHSGGTATCMAKASCETCGEPYGNLAPNNHDLTHHDAQSPTCTETGHTAYSKCDRSGCNYEEGYELIPKLNHAFAAAWEHDDDKHWHKCTRDGCTGVDAEAAHEWQPATYTAPKTCVCGATQGEPLTRSYYYYAPSAAEDKKDSPKAGDPGVLLYAGLALASLTGLTYTAKKRH